MKMAIPINLVIEDTLSEVVLCQLLGQLRKKYEIGNRYGRTGATYIKRRIQNFNQAAKGMPYFVLVDQDNALCPSRLINDWLPYPRHNNLIFRIAVREVESWILAHRTALARFLGIQTDKIPEVTDSILDPKQFLINLARTSPFARLREAMVPRALSTAKVGPGYNSELTSFLVNQWKLKAAIEHSPSLKRAVKQLDQFKPKFNQQSN